MAEKTKLKINKLRLIKELLVIFAIVFAVFLIRFLPWLVEQPIVRSDPYEKYQVLLTEVEGYDYSKGANSDLEKRLDSHTQTAGSDPVKYYYNLKAKALYYQNLNKFSFSNSVLDIAIRFAPTPPESADIYSMYIKNYQALSQNDKVKEYQELLDAIPN